MQILLKDLLKEVTTDVTTESPLKVQIYCDMDGVLADMDKGFKALSGGLMPKEYEAKNGKGSFWKIIGSKKDFWISLELMPDAKVLWSFLVENFKGPVPVVLTAGQGSDITRQKTEWMHKHFGPGIKVTLASAGHKKPDYIIKTPEVDGEYVTHVLVDDTQKNIDAWNNTALHRIAIHHKDAAQSIKALQSFITK